jgi:hypothetical protein
MKVLSKDEIPCQVVIRTVTKKPFGSFRQVVSEEKIFLEIDQSETRIAYGGHVC